MEWYQRRVKEFNDLFSSHYAEPISNRLHKQLRWVNTARSKDKPNYVCENKDNIELVYSTFKKPPFKMSQPTIVRGIDSLLAHGFLKVKDQGGRCRGHKTIYKYSEEWIKWKAGQIISIRQPFFARGFCV